MTFSLFPSTLLQHLRPFRARLMVAAMLVSISALLELVPYLVVYYASLEVFAPQPDVNELVKLALFAVGMVLVRFVFLGSGYMLSHAVAFSFMGRLRKAMAQKLLRVPASFLAERGNGALKKALVEDVASLEDVFAHNFPEVASSVFVPLVAFGILASVDWRLALASVALLPIAFGAQGAFMYGAGEQFEIWHQAEERANKGILEFIRGITVLKAFDRDASSLSQVHDGIMGIRDLAISMTRRMMSGLGVFMALLSGNLLVVLPVGLALWLMGDLSKQDLVLFVVLGMGMLMPLLKIMFLVGNAQKVKLSMMQVVALLDAPEVTSHEQGVGRAAISEHPVVRFEEVCLTYEGRDERALDEVSFELQPGTVTALIGPSGAGKTSLARLLVRQWEPDLGQILLDDQSLDMFSEADRIALISHVPQHAVLFDASIMDNLALAKPCATLDEIQACAKAAYAHDFIEALPQGYHTLIGDRGAHLSGGERQRLTIARAMLKNSPILVLDEITANVDPESERGIQEGLRELAKGRTVLVVAHRLRTVVDADQILVMDKGRLVAKGTHSALLEQSKVYHTMWEDQNRASQWVMGGEQ